MALASSFVVARTFLELAEESWLARARFNSDSALSGLKPGSMDGGCSTDHSSELTHDNVMAHMDQCVCSMHGDAVSGASTDYGGESDSVPSLWADETDDELDKRTTVMLRGLNSSTTRNELLQALNASSFCGCFDFIYVPYDLETQQPKGFAFINFATHMDAERFQLRPPASLGIDARAFWSDKDQGLSQNVARYRNSDIMHRSVPKHFRPSLVKMDSLVALPQPTRTLKAPKVKRSSC